MSTNGDDFAEAGSVEIPRGTERGRGAEWQVKTLFVDMPPALAMSRYCFVRWAWAGGAGRRIFFVYAFGYA